MSLFDSIFNRVPSIESSLSVTTSMWVLIRWETCAMSTNSTTVWFEFSLSSCSGSSGSWLGFMTISSSDSGQSWVKGSGPGNNSSSVYGGGGIVVGSVRVSLASW